MTPLEITLIVVVAILALLLLGAIFVAWCALSALGEFLDGIMKAVWR